MSRRSRRELWTAKVLGQLPAPITTGLKSDEAISARARRPAFQGVVLGVDPSLRGTGLAIVEISPRGARLLFSRTVRLKPGIAFAACLAEIFRAAQEALARAPVRHVVMEKTIFVQSRQVVHILGSARGAAMTAAALAGAEVFEYAPLRVKQAVVGIGRASKEQVARTVAQHLGSNTVLPPDEADAVAVALCHAFTWHE